jgi:hypothetical protein
MSPFAESSRHAERSSSPFATAGPLPMATAPSNASSRVSLRVTLFMEVLLWVQDSKFVSALLRADGGRKPDALRLFRVCAQTARA